MKQNPADFSGRGMPFSQALRRQGGDAALEARISAGREVALERHNLLRASHSDVTEGIQLNGWVFQIVEPSQV